MNFTKYFPMWNSLSMGQKQLIIDSTKKKVVKKKDLIHGGIGNECTGLILVETGQLRAFILSEEGREITLYRLFERDICLFSASCMMNSIQFEISIEAEKESEIWIIPTEVYKNTMDVSVELANYTNQVMASRFSDVMWLMEQIMWKSFDKRLADFLIEEALLDETDELKITHETIANHLGTAREVVTRMLNYFQQEGIVKLTRGTVKITDKNKLAKVSN